MCTQTQLHTILQAIYKKFVEEFGDKLDAVILYGSYARGDYDEDSDIDVMVRVKMDQPELMTHRKGICDFSCDLDLEYNVLTSIHLQSYEIFEQYKEDLPFYMNVIKDGVRISA